MLCGSTSMVVDAHHLVNRGTGSHKQNDWTAVPLCREDHSAIHQVGLAKHLGVRGVTIARLVESVAMQVVEYFREKKEPPL